MSLIILGFLSVLQLAVIQEDANKHCEHGPRLTSVHSVFCLPPVDKVSYMVGSYGPRAEEHEFLSPVDEAPKGVLSRGHYQIKSCFIDDDKNIYLAWEWNLDIKKDWHE